MTDFLPQSTDRVSDNTNPKVTNIAKQGSVTATLTAQSVGYLASSTVSLGFDDTYALLQADVYAKFTFGGLNPAYYKLGYCDTNVATGAVTRSGVLTVGAAAKPTSYVLSFSVWERTLVPDATVTFYYTVYTQKIAGS